MKHAPELGDGHSLQPHCLEGIHFGPARASAISHMFAHLSNELDLAVRKAGSLAFLQYIYSPFP